MGHLGAVLERLGAIFGLTWGVLGRSWGDLGAVLGRLGAILGRITTWGVISEPGALCFHSHRCPLGTNVLKFVAPWRRWGCILIRSRDGVEGRLHCLNTNFARFAVFVEKC